MTSEVPLLRDVKVVELAMWVAGPSCGGILADWGADVVKVESPRGDPQRNLFKAIGYREDMPNPAFALDNRGKRSVVFDLGTEVGREAMEKLVSDADVFLTNLRPAALKKIGLHPDQLTERYPSLIYAIVTGYGLDGPEAHRPGYDIGAFWARAGIARHLVPKGSAPVGVRAGLGDHVTGISTVSGICAALFDRTRTGKGRVVEVSLLRAGAYTIGSDIGIQLHFGRLESTKAREVTPLALLNSYKAGDGKWFWLIGVEAVRHFPGVARAIGREELLRDDRFVDAKALKNNSKDLIRELDSEFSKFPLAHWAVRFDREDVWWSPAQSISEVVDDPQLNASGGFVNIEMKDGHDMKAVASPVTFRGDPLLRTGPVPCLGEHTQEVLQEIGYTEEEVKRFLTEQS